MDVAMDLCLYLWLYPSPHNVAAPEPRRIRLYPLSRLWRRVAILATANAQTGKNSLRRVSSVRSQHEERVTSWIQRKLFTGRGEVVSQGVIGGSLLMPQLPMESASLQAALKSGSAEQYLVENC